MVQRWLNFKFRCEIPQRKSSELGNDSNICLFYETLRSSYGNWALLFVGLAIKACIFIVSEAQILFRQCNIRFRLYLKSHYYCNNIYLSTYTLLLLLNCREKWVCVWGIYRGLRRHTVKFFLLESVIMRLKKPVKFVLPTVHEPWHQIIVLLNDTFYRLW